MVSTLQKSMDFTPLEPRAGPTGGEGEAWPAPTMSLTIWSPWRALRAMMGRCVAGDGDVVHVQVFINGWKFCARVRVVGRDGDSLRHARSATRID